MGVGVSGVVGVLVEVCRGGAVRGSVNLRFPRPLLSKLLNPKP